MKTSRNRERSLKRRSSLGLVRISARPSHPTLGWLFAGALTLPAALGRSGIRADKREGDGGTPYGSFRPLRVWWRNDRLPRPRTGLPVRRISPADAWCENPADRRYNRPFRRSVNEPGDRLWRNDNLYDLMVEIDHNTRPRVAGRGSAIFLHVARPAFGSTAGCVALRRRDLQILLRHLSPKTRIVIRH
ncbi:MAG: L,D-transpeptidase family protein [Xanthobacteraceae bacterium]